MFACALTATASILAMPVKCSSCDIKFEKTEFTKEELKAGDDRRCKTCVASTTALFAAARSVSFRRVDDCSADAEVERLRSKDASVQSDAANRLWKSSRTGTEATDRDIAAAGAIGPLVELLYAGDERAWFAAGALQSLSCRSGARKVAIISSGGVPPLVAMLCSSDVDDQEVAAMALQNLSDGSTDDNVQSTSDRHAALMQANIVGPLVNLLQEAEPGAKEAAAAALGNLASCADGELRATVTAELCDGAGVARLVGLLREGNGLEEEAARALLHVVSHDADAGHVAAVAQALGFAHGGAVGDEHAGVEHIRSEIGRIMAQASELSTEVDQMMISEEVEMEE